MDNQHRLINGYRELNEADITVMNLISSHGNALQNLLDTVTQHEQQRWNDAVEEAKKLPDEEARAKTISDINLVMRDTDEWISAAKVNLRISLMLLKRAVAKPELF